MKLRDKPSRLAYRLRHPNTTVRWRLTLLYGGLFLVCGAALLAVTYGLVAGATVTNTPRGIKAVVAPAGRGAGAQLSAATPKNHARPTWQQAPGAQLALPPGVKRVLRSPAGPAVIRFVGSQQRISDLHQLEIESGIALAIMAIISAFLGWVVAGRVLRPLRTITATTQQISEANLHERLAMPGPRDELRTLADTIDGLLERLQSAFDAQRRFVANASHELRTPLTAARALLELQLSDPNATVETFRATCGQVLEEGERQEQLIDALLALARSQRGIDHPEIVDLAAVVGDAVRGHEPEASARALDLDSALMPARVSGDQRLIERLASNLLDNAIRHNTPHGWVRVRVETRAGRPTLSIANAGPQVPAEEIGRLLQPFQRLTGKRASYGESLGLGLSIVAAVADAHDAELGVHPGEDGGLSVELCFPQAAKRDVRTPRPAAYAATG